MSYTYVICLAGSVVFHCKVYVYLCSVATRQPVQNYRILVA